MKFSVAFVLALVSIAVATPTPEILEATLPEDIDNGDLTLPPPVGQEILEFRDVLVDKTLSSHNAARRNYGAKPLTWNSALYPDTLAYAKRCKFEHSNGGGKYGENLFAGSGINDASVGVSKAVDSWMSEASKYNYNNPVFQPGTGHFTQVVWKSSTGVACAGVVCPKGTIFPTLAAMNVVCRYTPPGNFQGRFRENVGRHI